MEKVPAAKSTYLPALDVPPQALSAAWIVELVAPDAIVEPDWVHDPEGMPPGIPAVVQSHAHCPAEVVLTLLQAVAE